jgi:cell division protein FtsW (lipid II flippase)
MGVVFGILVLLILLNMLVTGAVGCLRNTNSGEAAVGLAFLFGIVVQSVIAAASATGYFITIGLPFAFLAEGGTATLTNYTMAVFILYVTGCHTLAAGKSKLESFQRKDCAYGSCSL